MGRISVVKESDTGRNQRFVDNKTHKEMNCKEFVKSESLVIIFEICQNGVFFM